MPLIKKEEDEVVRDGDDASTLVTSLEGTYDELARTVNSASGDSKFISDENIHPHAGIAEAKIIDVDNHQHDPEYNLGEGVIGDCQLQWDKPQSRGAWDPATGPSDWVRVFRTHKERVKLAFGVTPAFCGRDYETLGRPEPKNFVMRVDFATQDGQAGPFSPGSIVSVVLTPQIPPNSSDPAGNASYANYMYTSPFGLEYCLVGVNHKGFDVWVCTKYVYDRSYFFSYFAYGVEPF